MHIILIALAFFLGYSLWEIAQFARAGDSWAFARAGASLLASAALGLYLRGLVRSPRGR